MLAKQPQSLLKHDIQGSSPQRKTWRLCGERRRTGKEENVSIKVDLI